MDALAKLFGSQAQVKIMRLFLFHPEIIYETNEVSKLSRVKSDVTRRELEQLAKAGLLKKTTINRESKSKKTKSGKPAKKKVTAWRLDEHFPYLRPLKNMLVNIKPLRNDDLTKRFQKAGVIKVIILAGIFIQDDDSRIDLLVVGDKLKENKAREVIKDIEAEIGKELVFAVFSTDDFNYRISVYDKLIRDVLDYPHELVVDKIGLEDKI